MPVHYFASSCWLSLYQQCPSVESWKSMCTRQCEYRPLMIIYLADHAHQQLRQKSGPFSNKALYYLNNHRDPRSPDRPTTRSFNPSHATSSNFFWLWLWLWLWFLEPAWSHLRPTLKPLLILDPDFWASIRNAHRVVLDSRLSLENMLDELVTIDWDVPTLYPRGDSL